MNQTQVKYARQRAEAIKKQKLAEAKAKVTTKGKQLSTKEKLAALANREFTIAPFKEGAVYTQWWNYVSFGETYDTVDSDALKEVTADINTKFDKLMDELILGDDETALRLMKEFENLV